jgi:hypothetical protein
MKVNYSKHLRDNYKLAVAQREAPVSGFRAPKKGYKRDKSWKREMA